VPTACQRLGRPSSDSKSICWRGAYSPRLADIAVPHEILVSADAKRLAEKDDDDHAFAFEPSGRRALKGFATPVEVFSLSRG
jgi:class 3 adenylate cyclase